MEAKPFNVKVTIVSPGLFRTNFLEAFPIAENKIEIYGTKQLVDAMNQYNGQQPGNPDKLVKIVIDTAGKENAPLHLLLGGDAYERATKYYKSQLENLEQLKALSFSTNFD
ncbi:short chain dehydrogenase [compost metagenome]